MSRAGTPKAEKIAADAIGDVASAPTVEAEIRRPKPNDPTLTALMLERSAARAAGETR